MRLLRTSVVWNKFCLKQTRAVGARSGVMGHLTTLATAVFYASFHLYALAHKTQFSSANFVKYPLSVLSVPSEILSSSVGAMSWDCAFCCLKTASCISFNFGIHSKTCELLATDKYSSSKMFNSSREFDHYSIMTPCVNQPCQVGDCLPIYNRSDFLCKSSVIHYALAALGQSCEQFCKSLRLRCVDTDAFPTGNAVGIFRSLGFDCRNSAQYTFVGDPYYGANGQWCGGARNIPNKTDCPKGGNFNIRRLCPCQ